MTDHSAWNTARLAEMLEAAKLTGSGRLQEATALIQRSLQGGGIDPGQRRDTAAARLAPPTIDLTAERREDGPRAEPRRAAAASPINHESVLPDRLRETLDGVMRGLGRGVAPVLKGLGAEGFLGAEGLGGLGRGPAPRPAGPPDTDRFVRRSYSSVAGARDYKLYIPSRPRRPAALVVMLHGCTQSPDDFAAGTNMNALAEEEGIFVAYPAQSRRANGQKCWNWFEPGDQGRESGEAAIVAGLTRAVMAEHGIDPARVYVAGFSAGAAAAANLARAYPDLYAGVGIHSGLAAGCARDLSSALMAMQVGAPGLAEPNGFGAPTDGVRVPTIVFHGDGDATVSPRNRDQVLAQAGIDALRPTREEGGDGGHPYTRTRYADAAGRVQVESWLVRGGGHTWSGGSPAGSYTDPRGPDASRAMLDFFAEHRLGAGQA
ncbi:extracellular catalytic domain type 1 short-chain-length polyhydroxyalkanoate depolymerase [Methylobacterium nigriterrae]|uniref:extracellular catalytic domain type 1 short-chain-length polyhydroxyalkanoate depolymerase n=1 Tax=Methylobacterium nigriterrae TaxID=3127512 RepID=UPI0030136917